MSDALGGSIDLGYFGNIWVKQFAFNKIGQYSLGHKHDFDHVTLLVQGKVLVEVEGFEPKEFVGPTFIVIKKEHRHKFTALSDACIWYCIFALRDLDGNVVNSVEEFYSSRNNPYNDLDSGDAVELEKKTTQY